MCAEKEALLTNPRAKRGVVSSPLSAGRLAKFMTEAMHQLNNSAKPFSFFYK